LEGRPDSEDEAEEKIKRQLTNEHKAVVRLSEGSSKKIGSQKNLTTMSGEFLASGKRSLSFREKLVKWFKSRWFSLIMLIITGWTMISEDFRQLGPKAVDPLFYTLTLMCIIVFVTDILMS
jgi:hypothetical protein